MSEQTASDPASRETRWDRIGAAVMTFVLAGLAGTIVWELVARHVAPHWFRAPLQPAGLVRAVFMNTIGVRLTDNAAEAVHMATGVLAYPAGYLFGVLPMAQRFLGWAPWALLGLAYGYLLFVLANYVMAHLLVGADPFFGWTMVAYASLVGHLLYGVALAWIVWLREG